MQSGTILVGLTELCNTLKLIMVVGIIVTEEVFITKNVIILLEAVSFFLFYSCIDFIAFKPNGVAALPTPSIFKMILVDI